MKIIHIFVDFIYVIIGLVSIVAGVDYFTGWMNNGEYKKLIVVSSILVILGFAIIGGLAMIW